MTLGRGGIRLVRLHLGGMQELLASTSSPDMVLEKLNNNAIDIHVEQFWPSNGPKLDFWPV